MVWFAGLLGMLLAGSLADIILRFDTEDEGSSGSDGARDDPGAGPGTDPSTAGDMHALFGDLLDEVPAWPVDTAPGPQDIDNAPRPPDADEPSLWDHLSRDPWAPPDLPVAAKGSIDGPDSTDAPAPLPAPGTLVSAATGQVTLSGNDGADTLLGGADDNVLHGGAGDDLLVAGGGANGLFGGEGDDTLVGGAGNDTLDGGPGRDVLIAGTGDTLLRGGAGADLLIGGSGADTLEGGAGDDTLLAGSGDAMLAGGHGNDLLVAGPGHDTLFGGDGDDTLIGVRLDAHGHDIAGPSLLNGGPGDDLLVLGRDDIAHGGSGADIFLLGSWMAGGGAVIADFAPGEDRLAITYDPGTWPADPVVTLDPVPDSPDAAVVRLDGVALAVVHGAAGLDPGAVVLVPGWPPATG